MYGMKGLGTVDWGAISNVFTTAVSAVGTPKPVVINQAGATSASAYLAQQAQQQKAKSTENLVLKIVLIGGAAVLVGGTAYFIYQRAKSKKK
jgi:beta-lactamase regulating signal transducer with metallopeptidase domain